MGQGSGGRWGSIAGIPLGPSCPRTPLESEIAAVSTFLADLGNSSVAGDLLSPASSLMSPRRAGSVPWVPRRPPYAILTSAYGNRRQVALAAAGRRLPYALAKIAHGGRLGTQGTDPARWGDIGEAAGSRRPPAQGKFPEPHKTTWLWKFPTRGGFGDKRMQTIRRIATLTDRWILALQ